MGVGHELTRVEFDGRGPRTTYEELQVGADLGTLEWEVRQDNVAGMLANDDDEHPWFTERSPLGEPVVPPMATYPPVRVLFSRAFNVRGLFYEFESTFERPLRYGERLVISGKITEKWVKRDREYVTYEAEGRTLDGELVFSTRRTHVLDFIPRTVPRHGVGTDSGTAQA